jgi:N-acetylglucosamine-6-phosphate deacetylase
MNFIDALTGDLLAAPPGNALTFGDADASEFLVGPALFDPQVNGFAGVDFMNADLTQDDLEHATKALQQAGCSHFLLTLITEAPGFLENQFNMLRGYIEASPLLKDAILGFHLEGPFLSEETGYIGAHPAQCACDPDWDLFQTWQEAAGGMIRLVTLAPERSGSEKFIQRCVDENILVSLGHTNASIDDLQRAVDAGARMFTHLGNGCPAQMHRHDNIIQRVLSLPELMVSIIPDGIHVPPWVLKSWVNFLGAERVVFTTDAMSAAGAPPGRYTLGDVEVEVGEDRIVRLPGTNNFAGSSLTPIEGLRNVMQIANLSPAAAWSSWTRLRDELFPEITVPEIAVSNCRVGS